MTVKVWMMIKIIKSSIKVLANLLMKTPKKLFMKQILRRVVKVLVKIASQMNLN